MASDCSGSTATIKPPLPVMQCPDRSVACGFLMVPFVSSHKQRVLVLERNGVIQRVKQMVIGLHCKAGCPSNKRRAVGGRKLEGGENFDMTDGRLRDESGNNRGHFGEPMQRSRRARMPSRYQVRVWDPQEAI